MGVYSKRQTEKLPCGQSSGDARVWNPALHPFDTPYRAVRTGLVSGPDDPSMGGGRSGAMTPFRRLYILSDRVCPRQMTKATRRRFRKWSRRLFGVNSLANFFSQLLYISFLERLVSPLVRRKETAFPTVAREHSLSLHQLGLSKQLQQEFQ